MQSFLCRLLFAFLAVVSISSARPIPHGKNAMYDGSHDHFCGHHLLEDEPILVSPQEYNNHPWDLMHDKEAQKRALAEEAEDEWQHIRIVPDLSSYPHNNTYHTWLKNEVVPRMIEEVKRLIKVRPVKGPLNIKIGCAKKNWWGGCQKFYGKCGAATIPTKYNSGANDTDYLVFVTGNPLSSALAHANGCQEDQWGRPMLGHINFGGDPQDYELKDPMFLQYMVDVAVHEMLHALGFSGFYFNKYRQPDGSNYPRFPVRVYDDNGVQRRKLVLPNALEVARKYFGCDKLDGIELENWGSAGSAGHHLELRLFPHDTMRAIASLTMWTRTSPITLAILGDSGWYNTKHNHPQSSYFGEGKGCDFVMKPCLEKSAEENKLPKNKFNDHWCTDTGQTRCRIGRREVGRCRVSIYNENGTTPIPESEQYYWNSHYGGDSSTDYCPNYKPLYFWNGPTLTFSTCRNTTRGLESPTYNKAGQSFGADSRCFTTSLRSRDNRYGAMFGNYGCYNVRCNADKSSYEVQVGTDGDWHKCVSGNVITPKRYYGSLTCAPYDEVCDAFEEEAPASK